jgi:hypothetical protein
VTDGQSSAPGPRWRGARRRGLEQPSKLVTRSGKSPNLRRILVDLQDEYARHVGHADLLFDQAGDRLG